jgi:hypothetical protein
MKSLSVGAGDWIDIEEVKEEVRMLRAHCLLNGESMHEGM